MIVSTTTSIILVSSLSWIPSNAFLLNPAPKVAYHPTSTSFIRAQNSPTCLPSYNNYNSPRQVSTTANKSSTNDSTNDTENEGIRNQLRQLTGFSMSALRLSLHASISAARLTLRGFTGGIVTKTMKRVTAIFPTGIRYFMQPFLILYFTPIMVLKSLCDRPKNYNEDLAAHEKLVQGWTNAVERAERVQNGEYWPVHINADGAIEVVEPPPSSGNSDIATKDVSKTVVLADAIVDSLDLSLNNDNVD